MSNFYNPSAKGMKKLKEYVKNELEGKNFDLLHGPLLVVCHFRIPAPLSATPKRRKFLHGKPHSKRPDGDNLEKFLNDSLNGILWQDDAQIAWLLRSKTLTYDKTGEIVLFVAEIDEEQTNLDTIVSLIQEHITLED